MLTSYLAMQNAVLMNNMANIGMMEASDKMMDSVSFGNSQPLKPAFSALSADELAIKANETKSAVSLKFMDALRKSLAKGINRSTPNYAGINYKA